MRLSSQFPRRSSGVLAPLGRPAWRCVPLLLLLLTVSDLGRLRAAPPTNWIASTPTGLHGSVSACVGFDNELLLAQTPTGFRSSFDSELWTAGDNIHGFGSYFFLQAEGSLYALPVSGNTGHLSTDGLAWRTQILAGKRQSSGMAYGNGHFVAAGTGTLDTSPDGAAWTSLIAPHQQACGGLVYVQSHFLLLSGTEGVWLSTNGVDWEPHALAPQPASTPLSEVVHWGSLNCLNGLCFAFGRRGGDSGSAFLAISANGGADWDVKPLDRQVSAVSMAYGNGQYVLLGAFLVGHSADGRHWTFGPEFAPQLQAAGLAFLNGRFVTVDTEGKIYRSDDGLQWYQRGPNSGALNAVAATPRGFVAVGSSGTILTSPNGFDWQVELSGTVVSLSAVKHCGDLTIVTGGSGTILTSPDDHVWTPSVYSTHQPTYPLRGVAYARGRYVVAGAYLTSTNGVTWEQTPGYGTDPSNKARAIIDDGTQFLSIAPAQSPEIGNVIGRSPDGVNWTFANTGLNRPDFGLGLGYAGGTYVALGQNFLTTSTDAATWQLVPIFDRLQAVIHTDDGFVAVGSTQVSTTNGRVLQSPDGTNWTSITLDATGTLNDVAYRDGMYVAVTVLGQILCTTPTQGARLAQHRWIPGHGFQFGFSGVPNRKYRVQSSSDLQTWSDLTAVTAPAPPATMPVIDPDLTTSPFRWYRAIEQ